MKESSENSEQDGQFPERRIKTDPVTGLPVLTGGPPITKEKVAKDFPVDCSRDAIILRRFVGLGKKDPFKKSDKNEANKVDFTDKEQIAEEFPRTCCRFARSVRRSVGLSASITAEGSDKCCFAD